MPPKLLIGFVLLIIACSSPPGNRTEAVSLALVRDTVMAEPEPAPPLDSIEILHATFLGNVERNACAEGVSAELEVRWKLNLGTGWTVPIKEREQWSGAGWTGQPLLFSEKGKKYLLQGSYDHTLKKIDLQSGDLIWEYAFDDVLKGTGTLWDNPTAKNPRHRLQVIQGSRRGLDKNSFSKYVFSLRGISALSGEEIWRMNIARGRSYSRDVDGSALMLGDTAIIGLENGNLSVFLPGETYKDSSGKDYWQSPRILEEHALYKERDHRLHAGNLVTESSPALLGNRVYITAGSGHLYGYNLLTDSIDWDFYIGSDLDGSPVVTADSCLLISIEKQYISGKGGVMKIDPAKEADSSVVWFFPVDNKSFSDWQGGVIGSPATNDACKKEGFPSLVAFAAIDRHVYVVDQKKLSNKQVDGPRKERKYPSPKLLFKAKKGPSISTPVFAGNRLVYAGYSHLSVFEFDSCGSFSELADRRGFYEATPLIHDSLIYLASRNGFLYCFGPKIRAVKAPEESVLLAQQTPKPQKEKPETKPLATKATPAPFAKPNLPKNSKESDKGPFHLVAGAFRSKSNAKNFATTLQKRGLQASHFYNRRKALNYVFVAHSSTENEAESLKRSFWKDEQLETWVFHNP